MLVQIVKIEYVNDADMVVGDGEDVKSIDEDVWRRCRRRGQGRTRQITCHGAQRLDC